MFKIRYEGDGEYDVPAAGQSLLQIARSHGVPHVSVCGGKGRCSTCRVLILDGAAHVPPRNEIEATLAQAKGLSPEIRLACQTRVTGDVRLRRLVHDDVDKRLALLDRKTPPPREVELAILFSDIRGFTTFSESQLPYDVVHILNRYFQAMGTAIHDQGGYIDKYMGDGIMALFGLEGGTAAEACRSAIQAARGMLERLGEENEHLEAQFDTRFRMGVGIHTGVVVVGEMGHPERMQFTALGDAVNVASRIESATKEAGVPILVSEAVRLLVPDLVLEDGGRAATLKGRSGVFQLHGVKPD